MAKKIGSTTVGAMARLGGREFRDIFTFDPKNIAQPLELGVYGTVLQSELAEVRRELDREPPELSIDD